MKRIILASFLLPLSACASIPTSPAVLANTTVLDEKGLLAVESMYKAEVILIEIGIRSGQVHGALATKVKVLDNKAYLAVLGARAAYATGNSSTYIGALAAAKAAIADLMGVVK